MLKRLFHPRVLKHSITIPSGRSLRLVKIGGWEA